MQKHDETGFVILDWAGFLDVLLSLLLLLPLFFFVLFLYFLGLFEPFFYYTHDLRFFGGKQTGRARERNDGFGPGATRRTCLYRL